LFFELELIQESDFAIELDVQQHQEPASVHEELASEAEIGHFRSTATDIRHPERAAISHVWIF
jgi:hypothetical protein